MNILDCFSLGLTGCDSLQSKWLSRVFSNTNSSKASILWHSAFFIAQISQRGRWEGGSGGETHVNPWLIHFSVWQNPLQYCKVISLQLIKKNKIKKNHIHTWLLERKKKSKNKNIVLTRCNFKTCNHLALNGNGTKTEQITLDDIIAIPVSLALQYELIKSKVFHWIIPCTIQFYSYLSIEPEGNRPIYK